MESRRPSDGSDQSMLPTLPPLAEVLHHDLLRLRCSSSSPLVTISRTQSPNQADNIYSPLPAHNNAILPQRQHAFFPATPQSRPRTHILNPARVVDHQVSSVKDGIPLVKPKRSVSHRISPNSSYTFFNSNPMSVAQENRPASHKAIGHRTRRPSPGPTSSRARVDTVFNGVGTKARHKPANDRYTSHRDYEESLDQIKSLSRTLCEFAETQRRISPARLPRQHEVSHMLRNMEIVKELLQQFNAPLPSPDTRSDPGAVQGIDNTSDPQMRPQHILEQATGPNLGIRPQQCDICKRNNVHISPPWKYRKETLCRACEFLRPRKETRRILRRGRPG